MTFFFLFLMGSDCKTENPRVYISNEKCCLVQMIEEDTFLLSEILSNDSLLIVADRDLVTLCFRWSRDAVHFTITSILHLPFASFFSFLSSLLAIFFFAYSVSAFGPSTAVGDLSRWLTTTLFQHPPLHNRRTGIHPVGVCRSLQGRTKKKRNLFFARGLTW